MHWYHGMFSHNSCWQSHTLAERTYTHYVYDSSLALTIHIDSLMHLFAVYEVGWLRREMWEQRDIRHGKRGIDKEQWDVDTTRKAAEWKWAARKWGKSARVLKVSWKKTWW